MEEKYYYKWEELDRDIEILTDRVKLKPSCVLGIARGGLIPAVMISHKLGVPFKNTTWQDRDGGVKEHIWIPDHTLIIDDINDTGLTLSEVTKGVTSKHQTMTLFNRKNSQFTVDYYANLVDNEWIVFPWEV